MHLEKKKSPEALDNIPSADILVTNMAISIDSKGTGWSTDLVQVNDSDIHI